MVEQNGCHWCERWNEEIGVKYDKTDESRRAPLRRVNIHALPDDLKFDSRPVYTPTFVLIQDGEELARIEGYPGEDFFWPMLNQIMDAHPNATVPQF
jgi:thioredoxin-related protein